MSKRQTWVFGYFGKDLIGPALAGKVRHEERLAFWRGEADATEAKLRAEGIQLRDYQMSGGMRYEAHIDQTLGTRLEECRSKVREHEAQVAEYALYARAFELNPDALLELNADDIRFFGL